MPSYILGLQVSALTHRSIRDKSDQSRYVQPGYLGIIMGWGRGTLDILWRIPKTTTGYYEVLECSVRESDIRIAGQQ